MPQGDDLWENWQGVGVCSQVGSPNHVHDIPEESFVSV